MVSSSERGSNLPELAFDSDGAGDARWGERELVGGGLETRAMQTRLCSENSPATISPH